MSPAADGLLCAPLAIVDLETTGANAAYDRVTEIAVIEARLTPGGGEVSAEWSTLVNPQTTIPPAIQALTGITNAMVAGAPSFAELAQALHERLAGRVLVAHNARFDYGFLKSEFERAGLRFEARSLCTVKLSRRLYPEHARHNLDSLMTRHDLSCRARHRALGDAEVVWQFLLRAAAEHGEEVFAAAAQQTVKHTTLPPHLARAEIDAIPDAPGVYIFRGEGGLPIYVGKSVKLRTRVLAHFADDIRSAKAMQLAREVRRIEWRRSAGEFGALLAEARLVKELAPAFNRRLRRAHSLCGFSLVTLDEAAGDPAKTLRLVGAGDFDAGVLPRLRGVFRSERAALAALRELADEHRLCLQSLGFGEAGSRRGACFRHQLRQCAGLCAGAEGTETHHARVALALASLQSLAWPYRGPIGLREHDAEQDRGELHVIDQWRHLGTVRSEAELGELLHDAAIAPFDLDQYQIIARQLRKTGARVVDLAPLARAG
ncbi:MAG: exonuclease domain-containing protein [Betaproteobacteria bacterium]|nr:exonuclease domain-containing protein [Betaproteobacteria bacterium]